MTTIGKYKPSGEGGTCSPAATPAKFKMAARGPKMVEGVFGRSKQLSLNKFFDPSTPSMRKGSDGENRKKRENRRRKD